jgi:hypothetical protein
LEQEKARKAMNKRRKFGFFMGNWFYVISIQKSAPVKENSTPFEPLNSHFEPYIQDWSKIGWRGAYIR